MFVLYDPSATFLLDSIHVDHTTCMSFCPFDKCYSELYIQNIAKRLRN